jgi:TolA-binding protein
MAQEGGPAAGGAGKDAVILKSGQQILNADVTDESYETVKINGEAKPAAEIESIRHGDQPPEYIMADSNFRQFQLDKAIENFKKARDLKARPWLKHYCDYYIGRSYQALAQGAATTKDRQDFTGKAIAQFESLIKGTPKGFWVPSAMDSLGQCYYNLGDYPKALAAYQQIEKTKMGESWTLRAQLWEGKIQTAQGQVDAAAQTLTKVSEAAKEKHADIYTDAQIALAECYIRGKKFKEAEDLLKGLIDANEKEEVRAVAHNTLGDCYKAQNKIKEARLEYLRTDVLYFKVKDQDARALFSAAECFELLKDKERADKLRDDLKKTYPDSPWARAL